MSSKLPLKLDHPDKFMKHPVPLKILDNDVVGLEVAN